MREGTCQCGAVRYRITGPVRDVIACHCRECRRMSGHYFAATAAAWEHVEIIESGDLAWFKSSTTSRRGFCRRCGSSLFFDHGQENPLGIAAGSLAEDEGLNLAVHIYVDEGGGYYGIPNHERQMTTEEWRERGWDFIPWHDHEENR